MIDPGTLFWLFVGWAAIVTATTVAWWYEAHVLPSYRRRAERLTDELEAMRDYLAGKRR